MSAGRTGAGVAATLLLVCVLVASLAAPAVAVHDAEERFVVELRADGTAQVTVERNYNLSVAADRETFAAYANNTTRLEEHRATVGERLRAAATEGTDATAREMRIENVTAGTVRNNGTGTVEVRARWVNLGGVYGSLVVVNEPFTSGFRPNGTLVVQGPPGYVRDALNPPPSVAQRNRALWGGGENLTGFSARFQDPQATTVADDGGDGDGADGGGGGAQDTPASEGVGSLVGAAGIALVPALLVVLGVQRRKFALAREENGVATDADDGEGDDRPAADTDGVERARSDDEDD